MKKRLRTQPGGSFKQGYNEIPNAIDCDYHSDKVLTKIAILECENGGKVITTERNEKKKNTRNTHYNIYQVRPDDNLMDILATVLVEARLK